MTIEEKARRYDEAKCIMKEYIESGNAGVIAENTIKKAFPELKESEDEKIRKWIKKELASKYVVDNIVNNMMADKAFAWLEKKGEQKPAWSEEDKNTIQVLKNIVRHSDEIDENIYTMSLKEKLYDWLKSLRPQSQWKPSDEQIRELGVVATGKGWFSKEILSELLEQLKKLMEE